MSHNLCCCHSDGVNLDCVHDFLLIHLDTHKKYTNTFFNYGPRARNWSLPHSLVVVVMQVHKLNLLMSRVTTNMPVIAVRSYYEEASRGYHLGIFGCYSITREVPLFMTSCNREFQSHAGDLAIDVAVQEIDCLRP